MIPLVRVERQLRLAIRHILGSAERNVHIKAVSSVTACKLIGSAVFEVEVYAQMRPSIIRLGSS